MKIWDDAQQDCQDLSSDSTADSLTFFNRMMNTGYKYILAQLGRPVTEKTTISTTVASQQYYQLPQDYLFLKSLTVTVGGISYPIIEEESQENWDLLNATTNQTSDIPERFFIRPSFGVAGAEIGFYPAPASSGRNITLVYEATDKDLSQAKYITGTITLTNGSAAVVGSGTTFIAAMVGRYLQSTDVTSDGMWYKIIAFTNATNITIENNYQGTTQSGVAYQIAEAFALPEEMQILPVYYALWHYFKIKPMSTSDKDYKAMFDEGLLLGMRRHGTKSRSALIRGKRYLSRFRPWAGTNFPQSVSS